MNFKRKTNCNKVRSFSLSSAKHMDDNPNSDGELSDHSETDVKSLDKNALIARRRKLEGRLKTSQKNSYKLCDDLEEVTDELQNIVQPNLDKLSAEDRRNFDQSVKSQSEGVKNHINEWGATKSNVGELHDNHASYTSNLLWGAWAKHFIEKNLLDPSSREKAGINAAESARIRKDLDTNSNNLIKDSVGLEKIDSKLQKADASTSSLVADYADPSTEMPSYMDPED